VNPAISLTYKWCKRVAICVLGGSVLLVGVCMIVLPGPALVVIPLGLGILGLEFAWARRWLRKMKEQAQNYVPGLKRPGNGVAAGPASAPASVREGGVPPAAQRASGSSSARNSSYDSTP
jgi:hypothetical protein